MLGSTVNAALDTMGENDTTQEHFEDTMRGGCYLEAESAVRNLTGHAPEVVRELVRLGVPFRSENGRLILRNFGGQKKKRTAYAKSSTGKMSAFQSLCKGIFVNCRTAPYVYKVSALRQKGKPFARNNALSFCSCRKAHCK